MSAMSCVIARDCFARLARNDSIDVIASEPRWRAWQSSLLFCFLLLFFISCTTPSTPPEGLSIPIPERWSQDLNAQASNWLAAQLRVYELPTQTKVHDSTMEVDETTGTVKAKSFKLPGGKTYKFIIEFQYLTSGNAIAFAYAEVEKEIGDGNAETVSFTSSDIRYEVDKQDPNISASISQGIIPDLDQDNDSWSSYKELKDKVSPTDPSSIPQPPTLKLSAPKPEPGITDLIITLEGEDNAHVEEMKLNDPVCGVTKLSETTGSANGRVTRQTIYKLDLRSVGQGNTLRMLQGIINDGVTSIQSTSFEAKFDEPNGDESHPAFVFTEPEEGTELEGITTLQGIACGRKEITNFKIRFNGEELTGYDVAMTEGDYGEKKVIINNLNTELIPDGEVEIQGEAIDDNGIGGQGIGKYKITNKSAIKVKQPEGRKWIYGVEPLSFSVVGKPSAKSVTVDYSGHGELSSLSTTDVNGTALLNVKDAIEGSKENFMIRSYDGNDVLLAERTVTFKVRNNPQIKQFSSEIVEAPVGYEIVLRYEVVNADTVEVSGDKPADEVLSCSEDSIMKGINVCKGEVRRKVKQIGENDYILTAVRGSRNNSQNTKVTGLNLSPSIPRYGVVSNIDDDASDEIKLPSSGFYRVKAIRLNEQSQEGPTDFEKEGQDGAIIPLDKTQLQPRTDYKIRLEKLTSSQGNVLGTMEKIVTTGDKDLVLWLRFNEDPKKNITCDKADDPAETICDYSGNNNHGIPQGDPEWLELPQSAILDSVLKFDGVNDKLQIANSISLNPVSLSIETKFKVSGLTIHGEQHLVDKRSQDPLGGNGYDLRLFDDAFPMTLYFLVEYADIGGNKAQIDVRGDVINSDTPYVVAACYDEKTGIVSLYKDGAILDSSASSAVRSAPFTSVPAVIGDTPFVGVPIPTKFNGILDELKIYDRALSAEEVDQHFNSY